MERPFRSRTQGCKLTKELALEAATLEAKMAELKVAMAKERARREAMNVASTSGSIWNNGAAGSLKVKGVPNSQQVKRSASQAPAASSVASTPANSSTNANMRLPQPPKQPPQASSQTRPTRPLSGGASSAQRQNAALGTSSAQAQPQQEQGKATAGIIAATAAAPTSTPSSVAPASSTSSSRRSSSFNQRGGVKSTYSSDKQQNDGSGIGCGGDDSLLCGTYDEAASRNSFLEALKEWRKADSNASSQAGGVEPQARPKQQTQLPGKQVETAAMVIQTDTLTHSLGSFRRGSSMQQSSSGNGASSGSSSSYFQRMLGCSRSSSTSGNAARLAADDHGGADSPHCTGKLPAADAPSIQQQGVHLPQLGQDLLQDQQLLDATGNSNAATEAAVGDAIRGAYGDEGDLSEAESPTASGNTCFDAWLQQTEQHAAAAAARLAGKADSSGLDESSSTDAGPAHSGSYQQQLQQVLANLERLEEQQLAPRAAHSAGSDQRVVAVVEAGSGAGAGSGGFVCFTAGMRLPDCVQLPQLDP